MALTEEEMALLTAEEREALAFHQRAIALIAVAAAERRKRDALSRLRAARKAAFKINNSSSMPDAELATRTGRR